MIVNEVENIIKKIDFRKPKPVRSLSEISSAMKNRKKLRQTLNFLRDSQWESPDWHLDYQSRQVGKLIEFAVENVPYYKEFAKKSGFKISASRSLENLARLPVISESDLNSGLDKFLAKGKSGGAGGNRSDAVWQNIMHPDEETVIHENAQIIRHCENAGSIQGLPVVQFVNAIENHKDEKYWYDRINDLHYFSARHLTSKTIEEYCARIKNIKSGFISGYPGALEVFADLLLEWEINLKFQGIITRGEVLTSFVREKIEHAFNAKIYDLYTYNYPLAGMGQCHYCDGFHVFSEFCVVELVDFNGNSIIEPGKVGRIVATNLINRSLPLLRYDTGDIGIYDGGECDCGRGLPKTIKKISGSKQELLIATDGKFLPPGALMSILNNAGFSTANYQLVQKDKKKFKLTLVRGWEHKTKKMDNMMTALMDYLGQDSEITVEPVSYFFHEGRKIRPIIREFAASISRGGQ